MKKRTSINSQIGLLNVTKSIHAPVEERPIDQTKNRKGMDSVQIYEKITDDNGLVFVEIQSSPSYNNSNDVEILTEVPKTEHVEKKSTERTNPLTAYGRSDEATVFRKSKKTSLRKLNSSSFVGALTLVSKDYVTGFAFDSTCLGSRLNIEIWMDGSCIGSCRADQERPDIVVSAGEKFPCGFSWPIPHHIQDGEIHRFEAKIAGVDEALPGSGLEVTLAESKLNPMQLPSQKGLALNPSSVWITGWAAETDKNDPINVNLYVDGEKVSIGLAGLYGADLVDNPNYPFKNVNTRFSFPTPAKILDGYEHEVMVTVPEWGGEHNKRVVRWAYGNVMGNVDVCTSQHIRGWVGFRSVPENTLAPVQIYCDQELIGQVRLTTIRSDVVDQGLCTVARSFSLEFATPISGTISVRYGDIELKGSPKKIAHAPDYAGNLDDVSRERLAGWVVDKNRPHEKIELKLIIDGVLYTCFKPSIQRPDVARHLGKDISICGYALPTPDVLLDGEDHIVDILIADNNTKLRGSGRRVRFPKTFEALFSTDVHPVLSTFIAPDRHPIVSAGIPKVSLVVLNRNGEDILDALFKSFVAVNSFSSYEFIIVDHASTDASLHIIGRWQENGLPIKIVPLSYNGSFSASNNMAIRDHARGEYVLLLNNDIVFVQDVLAEMIRTLSENKHAGMVGLKLLDVVEDRGLNFQPPVQHLGIRYKRFGGNRILPYDEKLIPATANEAYRPINPAGVTGAVMLMRRTEYLAIGGLDEAYHYGYEDVDMCLKYRIKNQQDIICRNDLQALHHRGYSRLSGKEMGVFSKLDGNHNVLMRRWGYAIKRLYRQSLIRQDKVYTSEMVRIAFAVTEIGENAVAGDYFTALELARALAKVPGVEPVFLSERNGWYDVTDVHVLIVMREDYDLRAIANARGDLIRVAWLRNQFEIWHNQTWFQNFDIYLSSAPRYVEKLRSDGYQAHSLPIATNCAKMLKGVKDKTLMSTVGFNGSAWGAERAVGEVLTKLAQDVSVCVAGRGWENSPLNSVSVGCLPYSKMPDFYASTEIVLDDANESARNWGSANSRVFDALAAGRLVLTNSQASSDDLFDGLLPVWNSPMEAERLVRHYLKNKEERIILQSKLQKLVNQHHSYSHRADEFLRILRNYVDNVYRISIKVPVPNLEEKEWWGDWHFAVSLSNALKAQGHSVRIDLLPDWDRNKTQECDDVVIVLRGLSEYHPDPQTLNLVWIISHPEKVSLAECKKYDHVFTASPKYTKYLQQWGIDASTLLQCTDPERMRPSEPDKLKQNKHLFVGNSRREKRAVIDGLLALGIEPAIFGREWEGLVPGHLLKGDLVSNEELHTYYSNAGFVYNDHWPDMAEWGFLSNRLFDAAACGANIISDAVDGIDEVFGSLIPTFNNLDELRVHITRSEKKGHSKATKEKLRKLVLSQHTFAHRAASILSQIDLLDKARTGPRKPTKN